jgi:hypothetical protein
LGNDKEKRRLEEIGLHMAAADLWVGDFTTKVSPSRGMQFWSQSAWGGDSDAPATFPATNAVAAGRLGDFESAASSAAPSTVTPTSQSHTPAPATFLVSPSSVAPSNNATKDGAICKYFATGGCTRGETCSFRHDLTIDAATDADASRGFVLMGQVVNLKQSNQAAGQKHHQSRSANNATPPHMMNPDARPFVSVDDVAANDAAMMESQYAAATSYQHNIRQPPLRFQAAPQMDAQQSAYYGGGYADSHFEQQQQYDQAVYGSGYGDYYDAGQYAGEDMSMYQSNSGGGHYSYHNSNNQYSSSSMDVNNKWKPTGVFSTTAETAAAKSVLAGYYDHALLNKEAVYQHRRFQAMRPPLQSNKSGAGNSSSSSLGSEDDSYDANVRPIRVQQGQQGSAVPTTWTYYPKPSSMDTVHHNHQSADTHRKLRNRPEF